MNLFGKIKEWAGQVKDSALSALIKTVINGHIKRFGGHMISFKMDTHEKTIELSADLKGEVQPVEFSIKYETFEQDGHTWLKADSITSSREWLTLVLAELIKTGQVPPVQVPPGMAEVAVKALKI